jgi:hypothetical protein
VTSPNLSLSDHKGYGIFFGMRKADGKALDAEFPGQVGGGGI